MDPDHLRAELAAPLLAAGSPEEALQVAAEALARAERATVTICDAEDLRVLAAAGPQLPDRAPFSGGRSLAVVNVGPLVFVVNPGRIDEDAFRQVAEVVVAAYERSEQVTGLVASEMRLELAQQLAKLGTYDWEIERDVNTWSDELFRIYGHEPGSIHPSYETFISLIHPDDRDRVRAVHRRAYETGEPYTMEERIVRPDGEIRTLRSNGIVLRDANGRPTRMTGICWDVTELRLADAARTRLGDAECARRNSLEINDTIVQGLALAAHALGAGLQSRAAALLEETLATARQMASDLLEQASDHGANMGVLTRAGSAEPGPHPAAAPEAVTLHDGNLARVLVCDDTSGMRRLIAEYLRADGNFVVVGEATTGHEAIEQACQLRPDLIVLDLSMPEMDGMRAIPVLRAHVPDARILVVSGYGGPMVQRALDAGAHAYIEKGPGFHQLVPRAREIIASVA